LNKDSCAFHSFIDNMKLVDIVMNNGTYAWNNKRGGVSQVAQIRQIPNLRKANDLG